MTEPGHRHEHRHPDGEVHAHPHRHTPGHEDRHDHDHRQLRVCRRCGANAHVTRGLCRRCHEILLGTGRTLPPPHEERPRQAEPEPLHSPPWKHRGS